LHLLSRPGGAAGAGARLGIGPRHRSRPLSCRRRGPRVHRRCLYHGGVPRRDSGGADRSDGRRESHRHELVAADATYPAAADAALRHPGTRQHLVGDDERSGTRQRRQLERAHECRKAGSRVDQGLFLLLFHRGALLPRDHSRIDGRDRASRALGQSRRSARLSRTVMLEAIADLYQQFLSGLPEPASMLIDFVVTLFPRLLEGAFVSVQLLLLSGVVGNLLALPVALARVSRNPLLRVPSYLFILLMRGTPLLVQIYILYYGVGHILGQIPLVRSSFLWRHLDAFWYAAA